MSSNSEKEKWDKIYWDSVVAFWLEDVPYIWNTTYVDEEYYDFWVSENEPEGRSPYYLYIRNSERRYILPYDILGILDSFRKELATVNFGSTFGDPNVPFKKQGFGKVLSPNPYGPPNPERDKEYRLSMCSKLHNAVESYFRYVDIRENEVLGEVELVNLRLNGMPVGVLKTDPVTRKPIRYTIENIYHALKLDIPTREDLRRKLLSIVNRAVTITNS